VARESLLAAKRREDNEEGADKSKWKSRGVSFPGGGGANDNAL